jgi:hypothetical protein
MLSTLAFNGPSTPPYGKFYSSIIIIAWPSAAVILLVSCRDPKAPTLKILERFLHVISTVNEKETMVNALRELNKYDLMRHIIDQQGKFIFEEQEDLSRYYT